MLPLRPTQTSVLELVVLGLIAKVVEAEVVLEVAEEDVLLVVVGTNGVLIVLDEAFTRAVVGTVVTASFRVVVEHVVLLGLRLVVVC